MRWSRRDEEREPVELDTGHPLLERGPLRWVRRIYTCEDGREVEVLRVEWGVRKGAA